jgi:D-hydroxyproline dehydrogenase subunit gamma
VTCRIESGVERGPPIHIDVNGETVQAYAGESVAAALLAVDVTIFHRSRGGQPRGPFCNMGTCFECLVRVGKREEPLVGSWVRACVTSVEDGMSVTTNVDFANRNLRAKRDARPGSPSAPVDDELANHLPRERGGE